MLFRSGGVKQVLTDVACDQSVTIFESDLAGFEDGVEIPAVLRLYPGRPNPFNSVTSIRYDLPESACIDLEVFDVTGRLVRRRIDHKLKEPGRHYIVWNGRNDKGRPAGPGIYFCRLSAGPETQIQRIILLR